MKKMITVAALLVFSAIAVSPVVVNAAEKVKSKVVMKEGNKVHLFHSGTELVKKEICLNDVIPVYREMSVGYRALKGADQVKNLKAVGKVKVLSYVGDHYFEAEIVEGDVRSGDVAKKEGAYCLVQPAE
ncbi:MAG: hypothetical protein AB9919_07765 [Geobacteraceae bacterium]